MCQGKNIDKLYYVVNKIANGEKLVSSYRNHKLVDEGVFKDCYECHVNPDWSLIYKYKDYKLVLVFICTGGHSDIFK